MAREENRVESLDWLRALAIAMVLVHHIGRGVFKGFLPSFIGESWTGVDLFFVLSGYLVTHSFSDWLDRPGIASSMAVRARFASRYALRRLVRIVPPAWLWAAIPFFCAAGFNKSGGFGDPFKVRSEFFGVISFFYNYFTVDTGLAKINYFWSLAVEEHFYVVLPFFFLLVRRRSLRLFGLLMVVAICGCLRIVAVDHGESPSAIRFLTHFRADSLAIGAILGLLSDRLVGSREPRNDGRISRIFSLFLVTLSVVFLWIAPSVFTVSQIGQFGLLCFGLVSAFLVFSALRVRPPVQNRFGNWVGSVGRRSFSLYLIHLPVFHAVREARFRFLGMDAGLPWTNVCLATGELAFYLLVLWGITELNFRWVERPLVRWGRLRFSSPKI